MIEKPPCTPMPQPEQDRAWFGELTFQYPLDETLCALEFGHLTKAKNELLVIIHRIGASVFDKEVRIQLCSELLFNFITQLDSWYSGLPTCLSPAAISFPAQLKLQ